MQGRQPGYTEEGYDYYSARPGALRPFSSLDDWAVIRGMPDIRDWKFADQDGNDVGRVRDLLVDTVSGEVIFAVLNFSQDLGIPNNTGIVPLDRLQFDDDNKLVRFRGSVDELKNAPPFNPPVTDYTQYYDYWSRSRETAQAAAQPSAATPAPPVRLSPDMDLTGWDVLDRDGRRVGKVDGFLLDPGTHAGNFVILNFDGAPDLGDGKTLIPFDHLKTLQDRKQVLFSGTLNDLRNAPKYRDDVKDFSHFVSYWRGGLAGRPAQARTEGRVQPKTRIRVARREVAPHRTVAPGEQILREGDTIVIPIAMPGGGPEVIEVISELVITQEAFVAESEPVEGVPGARLEPIDQPIYGEPPGQ